MKNSTLKFFGRDISYVAALCGLNVSTVWRHAQKKRTISPHAALRYAKFLGIPLSALRPDLWPPQEQPEQAARHG